MQLSIIIPTKDRGKIFDKTLASAVQAVQHIRAEIIVVNDIYGGDLVIPSQELVQVTVVRNDKPGVASKRNLGASLAQADLLLFLDDDILISKEVVNRVIALHRERQDIAVNPSWIYPPSLTSQLAATAFGRFMIRYNLISFKGWYSHPSWKDNELFQSQSVASFHLSISKDNFVKSGGYNEKFIEAGFEDYDFPRRLMKLKLSFMIDAGICVFHNEEDRISLTSWLVRQERGAYTRREAVALGYAELALRYGILKKLIFSATGILEPLLQIILRSFSRIKSLDPLSFKIILLLQANSIYQGYTHKVSRE